MLRKFEKKNSVDLPREFDESTVKLDISKELPVELIKLTKLLKSHDSLRMKTQTPHAKPPEESHRSRNTSQARIKS